ncbi:hypothetical protein AAF712_012870 [Marasmius tenuissimus]|uniref:Uncharacterized protein n=1 Tax=Marasmius tenuissimus TaxID=585030 RepID=A0ABR2ZGQ0_9AGAR
MHHRALIRQIDQIVPGCWLTPSSGMDTEVGRKDLDAIEDVSEAFFMASWHTVQVQPNLVILMRELRSLRQLPSNSTMLQTSQELIDAIVSASKPPSASLILVTSPFTSLILLTSRLLPIFQDNEGAPTRVSKDAIDLVQSTLRRLQEGKTGRSFGRMELFPPEPPEFSSSYTCVYKPSDLTVKTLSEQLDSV